MTELSPTSNGKSISYVLQAAEHSFAQFVKGPDVGVTSYVYPPGVELFSQGALPREIFFLESGLAKLVCGEESGRQLIIDIRFAGSLLGLSALINNQPHPTSAMTATHCRLIRISAAQITDLLGRDRQLARSVQQILSGEVLNQAARIAEMGALTARQRLENFIWRITMQTKAAEQSNSKLQLPLKQWEVAQFLAITPAYLCRLLAELESEEKIVRRNGWIVVCTTGGLWHRAD